ncbi:DNA polymerase III subunit gamma/tau, partial [Candidatus Parcubacteria bacterium]|nr:DNA polymerase III subunit gamma/tau [Candidatus Parcubacteria bacterium]
MSEHTSLYRKYRPSNFSEVLGQDHIISVLQKAIENKNPNHAYIFTGSRGVGKTSI